MSRSYKKHSFGSYVAGNGMKAWRTQENRRLRHKSKQMVNTCIDFDGLILPDINDFEGLWSSPRDGKLHYVEAPLINQCEFDNVSSRNYWRMYKLNSQGHHQYCNCYYNKRGWYWKNRSK